jgi:citrate lyase synthetase
VKVKTLYSFFENCFFYFRFNLALVIFVNDFRYWLYDEEAAAAAITTDSLPEKDNDQAQDVNIIAASVTRSSIESTNRNNDVDQTSTYRYKYTSGTTNTTDRLA